jgi:hypothetical protein
MSIWQFCRLPGCYRSAPGIGGCRIACNAEQAGKRLQAGIKKPQQRCHCYGFSGEYMQKQAIFPMLFMGL